MSKDSENGIRNGILVKMKDILCLQNWCFIIVRVGKIKKMELTNKFVNLTAFLLKLGIIFIQAFVLDLHNIFLLLSV
jgi:hypothetical protein